MKKWFSSPFRILHLKFKQMDYITYNLCILEKPHICIHEYYTDKILIMETLRISMMDEIHSHQVFGFPKQGEKKDMHPLLWKLSLLSLRIVESAAGLQKRNGGFHLLFFWTILFFLASKSVDGWIFRFVQIFPLKIGISLNLSKIMIKNR